MKADRLFLGLLLVFSGIVWVLLNMGIIPLQTVLDLWRFWPLLLVIWGILLILGKGSGTPGCLLLLIIFIALAGAFFSATFPFFGTPGAVVVDKDFSLPLEDNMETLKIDLVQHAGEITLAAFPVASGDELLMRARVQTYADPQISHSVKDGVALVTIRDASIRSIRNRVSNWQLFINEKTPAVINFSTGATRAQLDLARLHVERLTVKAGAGDITLRLGEQEGVVNIDSGAGNITVYVPQRTGVRLWVSGGLVTVNSEEAGVVPRGDRHYTSENLEEKHAVVDLHITAGAGAITLRPAPPGDVI